MGIRRYYSWAFRIVYPPKRIITSILNSVDLILILVFLARTMSRIADAMAHRPFREEGSASFSRTSTPPCDGVLPQSAIFARTAGVAVASQCAMQKGWQQSRTSIPLTWASSPACKADLSDTYVCCRCIG